MSIDDLIDQNRALESMKDVDSASISDVRDMVQECLHVGGFTIVQPGASGRHMMQRTATVYVLSTGKVFRANAGAISLGPDNEILEGYDGPVEWDDTTLEPSERREIAEYMIQRWTAYRIALTEGEAREAQSS